jgi:hypothetical protein
LLIFIYRQNKVIIILLAGYKAKKEEGRSHSTFKFVGKRLYNCEALLVMDILRCSPQKPGIAVKAVPLHAMEALGGRGGIAPTHS